MNNIPTIIYIYIYILLQKVYLYIRNYQSTYLTLTNKHK